MQTLCSKTLDAPRSTLPDTEASEGPKDDRLLIVDSDRDYRASLCHTMQARGYSVSLASSISMAELFIAIDPPAFALVEMRLVDGSGLDLVELLSTTHPTCRTIVLTAYGSIPTAVAAVNAGAFDFLVKPVHGDMIHNALRTTRHDSLDFPFTPMCAETVRRKHIREVFDECHANVSETARRLRMHRRTLQRILLRDRLLSAAPEDAIPSRAAPHAFHPPSPVLARHC